MGLLRQGKQARRIATSAGWLLVLALVLGVVGCAGLDAEVHATAALTGAGYRDVHMTVDFGSEFPPNGLIILSYSAGPVGNDQRDAQQAEKIVWDTYSDRFGVIDIDKQTDARWPRLAHLTYAQLAAAFGPRPQSLENASAATVHREVLAVVVGVVIASFTAGAIALIVVLRAKRRQPPDRPPGPPGPPGPPPG